MFNTARLKLTAWYLLIVTLISVAFSLTIYRFLSIEIERFARAQKFRIERQLGGETLPPPQFRMREALPVDLPPDPELISESKNRIIVTLIIINGVIVLSTGVLGYFLAGRTLLPIKNMVDEQNRFISDSSHELRTPLTALKSSLEVHLRDKNLSIADAKKLFSENLEEVNRLQKLSDGLLELAQFQKPQFRVHMIASNLKTIVDQATKRINPLAREKSIIVSNKIKDTKLKADTSKITDLLVILLDNAIKYSSPKQEVVISSKTSNHQLLISVKDSGIGIDQKDIPHIFDRFYRADQSRSRNKTNGFGLGLSIAQSIATAHNGQLVVSSELGKGSIFTVRLPLDA